jgi:hypothetical protein
VKVLSVSGYPRQELPACCAFLPKLFRTEELLAKIRAALDTTGRSLARLADACRTDPTDARVGARA